MRVRDVWMPRKEKGKCVRKVSPLVRSCGVEASTLSLLSRIVSFHRYPSRPQACGSASHRYRPCSPVGCTQHKVFFWDPPPVALCHLSIRVDSVRITLRNQVVVHRRACRFLLHLGSLLTISSWFVRLVNILLSALFHPLQVRSLTCCESARVPTGSLCILFLHLYRFFETKASWLHVSAAVAQKNSSPELERLSVMETAWPTDRDLVMFTRQTCPCT